MRRDLEKKLFEKYPEIFRQKDLPMTQTCMCWGIECGDGWYWLLDKLCASIQSHIRWSEKPQVEALQVKEKYGGLRFYCLRADELVEGMIQFAEHLSFEICEKCGGTEGVRQTKGWIKTLCFWCFGNEERRKEDENGSGKNDENRNEPA